MPSLLTISIYDIHHILGRFIRLYRQVQVVSDCLAFTCSILCCQCWAMLPDNPDVEARSESHEGYLFLPQHVIDARNAGGDLPKNEILSEFSPQKEDSEEVQRKCVEFWRKEQISALKREIESNKSSNNISHMELNKEHPSKISSKTAQGDELPAVHAKSKISNSLILKSPTLSV
ncbi:uncharacterized protein LOC128673782 [Plodia interpunctella]|uniref:uncharacterized protein LOC128673782 n=1 Tax=Plodia interpunctella TaxID=58824 RepID=UPI00236757D4|nr:uncharacterized protein LOC128673782 [Plodia interpunctella]